MSFAAEKMKQRFVGQAGRPSAENGPQGPGQGLRGESRRPRVLQGALLPRAQTPGHRSQPGLWVCGDYGTLKFRTKGNILTTSHSPNAPMYICIDSTVFFSICRVFLTI